jgi:hypothetical protein
MGGNLLNWVTKKANLYVSVHHTPLELATETAVSFVHRINVTSKLVSGALKYQFLGAQARRMDPG